MKSSTLLGAVNAALADALQEDDAVVVYGEDIGVNGGVFQATAGLQSRFGKRRCFDSPIAESGLVGTAVGMAMAGLKPVVEIQFSGFVWPAFNQIVCHAARTRNRSRAALTLPMVVRMPYGGNLKALEHHSESMEATFGHVPGLKVVIPSTPHDAKGLLLAAIRDPDPVIYMEPKRSYHSPQQAIPDAPYVLPLGRARVERAGDAVTLIAYGAMMREARTAAAWFHGQGIGVELIDLRTIYPYDCDTVLDSVRKTGRLVVVHEGPRSFGVAAELMALATEELFMHLDAPPRRVTGSDAVIPLPAAERFYFLTAEHIVDAVRETVEF